MSNIKDRLRELVTSQLDEDQSTTMIQGIDNMTEEEAKKALADLLQAKEKLPELLQALHKKGLT